MGSGEASDRTLRKRSQNLSVLRSSISKGDGIDQFRNELKHLEKEEREKILEDEGLIRSIPASEGLAMKANLCLP